MRLSPEQTAKILSVVHAVAGDGVRVSLFGSRLRDDARGGDVDLVLQSRQTISVLEKAKIKSQLEGHLQLPVDIVVAAEDEPHSAFADLALSECRVLST